MTDEISEIPIPPVDPAAVGPDAVKTVDGRKYGWQQPAKTEDTDDPATCAHTGLVPARMALRLLPNMRNVGDIWLCTCGQEFEVIMSDGGNKIMCPKAAEEDEPEE